MAVDELNHINIRTLLMEETKDFFVDVVGLKVGFRPEFPNHGYWLYCGDVAIVHLSPSEEESERRTVAEGMGDGLDHIGLSAHDLEGLEETLSTHDVQYSKRLAASGQLVQVFFHDPNGVLVEIAFDSAAEGVSPEAFTPIETPGVGA